jgi:predicted RNA binding protein YcfA (HicA-like mRNA interferase family)
LDISLRNRSAKDVLKDLEKDGWFVEYQQGSHKQLGHTTKSGKITIPWHRNGAAVLHPKIVKGVYKAAGLLDK